MHTFRKFVDKAIQVGGWALLLAACLVTYDVTTRKLFNYSIAGADEISGYVFAASTALAFSYALLTRANIRIDFVYVMLPEGVKRALDLLSMALTAGFFGVLCYFAYNLVSDAYLYGSKSITPLQTPLAIPQSFWFAGLCLALMTSITLLVLALRAMLAKDLRTVEDLVGIPTIREEIELETGGATAESPSDDNSDPKLKKGGS